MIQKMKNLLVIGPKERYQDMVDILYDANILHLEDVSSCYPEYCSAKQEGTHECYLISSLLTRLGGMLQVMPVHLSDQDIIPEDLTRMPAEDLIRHATEVCDQLDAEISVLAVRKGELELLITTLSRYSRVFRKISPIGHQLPVLEGYEVTVLIIQKQYKEVLDIIRPFFSGITDNQFEFIPTDLDEENLGVITVFHKRYSQRIHDLLFSKNVSEVRMPQEYSNLPLNTALLRLEDDMKAAVSEEEEIQKQLEVLSGEWSSKCTALLFALEDRKATMDACSHFGETGYLVLIKGWVPKKYISKLKKKMSDTFGETVVITILPDTPENLEKAPVFYENPFWVRPFEFFMQLSGLPSYREVDPTPILAIFFPIFFGLIVGDIGYGVVIGLIALYLKKRYADISWIQQISQILIISSIPAIFFGFLFGEFFGDLGEILGWIHSISLFGITWNRMEAIIPLLILTVGIGAMHIFLGLGIGVYNAVIRRKKKRLCEKCGMIGVLMAILLLLGSLTGLFPLVLIHPAIITGVISLVLLIYGGGALGAIEIMGTLGNIISYARLMAIGLASVILAVVANRLFGEIDLLFLGVLITLLLHILNIMLAMFTPSIHAIRLHLVEFFPKFYEGGGEPYRPFGRDKI